MCSGDRERAVAGSACARDLFGKTWGDSETWFTGDLFSVVVSSDRFGKQLAVVLDTPPRYTYPYRVLLQIRNVLLYVFYKRVTAT